MATHRMSVLGVNTLPGTAGNVYQETYAVVATNDTWKHGNFVFIDTSTRDALYGTFEIPINYIGSPKIIVVWTAGSTTGNVVWDFDYRAVGGNDLESLDQSTAQESLTVTDAAPSAVNERLEAEMSVTAGNLAAQDTVEFLIARDGTASDTMAAKAVLVDLLFEYSDV